MFCVLCSSDHMHLLHDCNVPGMALDAWEIKMPQVRDPCPEKKRIIDGCEQLPEQGQMQRDWR